MKPDRLGTTVLLIDIKFHDSINAFEEFYGEGITYQELEQESYVEFKEIMFESINKNIKFRKYGRIGHILTVKADMFESEIDIFKEMLENNSISMLHGWIVTNVTIIRDNEPDTKTKK